MYRIPRQWHHSTGIQFESTDANESLRLIEPVVSELGPWLRHHQTHVIHFVGHGDFDERLREGVIYFQSKSGASAPFQITANTNARPMSQRLLCASV